ncbi:MAG: PepSY domain-containing protein [Nitrospirae bacterium]|nr:MAG: PepSY domain-containing protein [Nitrospirota bacterium]
MRYALAIALLVAGLFVNNAWAASDKEMALEARIPMEQAIATAVQTVPGGKPYEIEMSKENGRATYKVEIVDPTKKTYKVWVDAFDGKIVQKKD